MRLGKTFVSFENQGFLLLAVVIHKVKIIKTQNQSLKVQLQPKNLANENRLEVKQIIVNMGTTKTVVTTESSTAPIRLDLGITYAHLNKRGEFTKTQCVIPQKTNNSKSQCTVKAVLSLSPFSVLITIWALAHLNIVSNM